MRTTSKQFDELADLTWALVNDRLGVDEGTRLEQMIADSTAARRTYIELMGQFAGLEWEKASVRAPCIATADGHAAAAAIPAIPRSSSIVGVMCHWPRQTADYLLAHSVLLSLLVATVVIGSLLTTLSLLPAPTYEQSKYNCAYNTDVNSSTNSPGRQPRDKDGNLNFVARITGKHNCRWSPEGRAPLSYDYLGVGRELKLDSGMVEITYKTGAKIVLEGPVEFTVEEANACRLEVGKLAANVPKPAAGFTVETPTATIVDLGTEFGVEVEQGGDADVRVFQGVVELQCTGVNQAVSRRRISAGQTARVGSAGIVVHKVSTDNRREQFVRSLPGRFPSGGLIAYWPMDGDATNVVGNGLVAKAHPGVEFVIEGAKVGSGAADFRNTTSAIEVNDAAALKFLEFKLERTFTLTAWAKATVAPGSFKSVTKHIISFGMFQPRGLGLYVNNKDGRCYYTADSVTVDLFDDPNVAWQQDRWHHYAMTYDAAEMTLKFYFDGKLKNTQQYIGPVDIASCTTHQPGKGPFTIGAQSKSALASDRQWVGLIDDVAIWDKVLEAEMIRKLADGVPADRVREN